LDRSISDPAPARIGRESLAMISDKLTLAVAAAAVLLLLSAVLGFGIAGILRLWHKYKPVKEAEVHDDKHPLGLDR
jgi:galactitol-specific phosphotransferase system IIC component